MHRRSVESGQSVEIILNLAWALVAIGAICIWQRTETRVGRERHLPFIALVMLIVILFPVISVSDDLWSIQNPAETDTLQRRDQLEPCTHFLLLPVATLCETVLAQPDPRPQRLTATLRVPLPVVTLYTSHQLANRPPPTA
jgi:hypothetical protein